MPTLCTRTIASPGPGFSGCGMSICFQCLGASSWRAFMGRRGWGLGAWDWGMQEDGNWGTGVLFPQSLVPSSQPLQNAVERRTRPQGCCGEFVIGLIITADVDCVALHGDQFRDDLWFALG